VIFQSIETKQKNTKKIVPNFDKNLGCYTTPAYKGVWHGLHNGTGVDTT
jgi:hypothetical protein